MIRPENVSTMAKGISTGLFIKKEDISVTITTLPEKINGQRIKHSNTNGYVKHQCHRSTLKNDLCLNLASQRT
jgi:hypothetical protein